MLEDQEFDARVVQLTLETRQQLHNAETLIRTKREELNIEICFDLGAYFIASDRVLIRNALADYSKLLNFEKSFYISFHNTYVKRLDRLCEKLPTSRRQSFWHAAMPGLVENHELRMGINEAKQSLTRACRKLLNFVIRYESQFSLERGDLVSKNPNLNQKLKFLNQQIDAHLEEQQRLAMIQRERYVA